MPLLERKYGGSAKMRSTQAGGDGGEDVEAVALEDFDVVLGVVEDGGGEGGARRFGFSGWGGEMRRGFGHGFGGVDDQVGPLIEW